MQVDTRGNAKKKNRLSRLVPLAAALLSALVWSAALVNRRHSDIQIEKERARGLMTSVCYTMQMTLKDYFSLTNFWAEYIWRCGAPDASTFYMLNEALDFGGASLVSVSLAPRGIVSLNYPKGGANILGTNLFTDVLRADESEWSRLTAQTTLTGPISTGRSGMVFEIRSPVYTPGEDGSSVFWGFALTAIKMDSFFEDSRLESLRETGFDYQIKRINTSQGKLDMVSCTTPRAFAEPVSHTFAMQNTAWTLLIEPSRGWGNNSRFLVSCLVALLFTLLFAFTMYSLWMLITRERSFKRMSYFDSLTGLCNSRKFYEDLGELQKNMQPYALLYLDLNDFKPVNDNFGHKAGDQLLAIVAAKLQRCVRGGTGVYRIGGDEFCIIIPNDIGMEALENLCVRIKSSLMQRITLETTTVHIGTSIGYARCPSDGFRYTEVIQKAEAIMYADKKQQHARR